MSFSVTILGSSSAKPTLSRHPSAQVVNVHEQYYLVDAGEGVQQQLNRYGINPLRLRAVFISHLHGDHVFGLFPLISTLALYDVQNPGNLGMIVRLADWFGITDIVCSEASADCFNPKVVQATMGAILRVRVHYTDLGGFLRRAADAGLPVCGTFLEGENIYGASLPEAGIVVMGNEGRGISDAAAATVTRKLFIPPYPADRRGSESLNVAMATGIVCAEFRRQAGTGGPGQARRSKK